MKILLYGRLCDAIGPEIDIQDAAGWSIADVRERLAAEFPAAAATLASKRSAACVGGSLVGDDYRIGAGEEVEFLPPVSGG